MLRSAPRRSDPAWKIRRVPLFKGETMPSKMRWFEIEQVAGNGLPDRRALLGHGVMLAGAVGGRARPGRVVDRRRRRGIGGRAMEQ